MTPSSRSPFPSLLNTSRNPQLPIEIAPMDRRRCRNPRNNLTLRAGGKDCRKNDMDTSDHFSDDDYLPSADSDGEVEKLVLPVQPESPRPANKRKSTASRRKKEDRPLLEWEKWEEENNKWVAALEAEGENEASHEFPLLAEAMEPSKDVELNLLRFQKEWLAWALKQEDSRYRGGILADEMGMGKTIQAISLVLTARSLSTRRQLDDSVFLPDEKDPLPTAKCTLVICPVVAVIQWLGEIDAHTTKGAVKVLVFHGPKRSAAGYNFDDYDFVITTYSTIATEFRKYMMPPKVKCQYCGNKLYPNKMKTHLQYFCGPYAKRTEAQAKQVRKKRKNMKYNYWKKEDLPHKGKNDPANENMDKKIRKYTKLEEPTNIITEEPTHRGKSVLHSVQWERIILDEAHFIKDRHCNTARAVFALHSLYKWALSGTPLQNRVGELYSLVTLRRDTLDINEAEFYEALYTRSRLQFGT
ncbi:hypothetical protein KSP40_PGU007486 [Platanthera guangdongensis]|uniref:Helicase ATP-binding domain-containing protein n=1 Tax=Platanthera guangdongensis TaxID=2320717 RepID=A0ABR2ME59_9ASPA